MLGMASIGDFVRTLRDEKVRTATTLLGLSWGTFSFVVLLALGLGLEELMATKSANLGRDITVVWPRRTTLSHAGLPAGRWIRVRPEQVLQLAEQIPDLDRVCPEFVGRETLRAGQQIHQVVLSGVYPDYAPLRSWRIQPGGRFLNRRDIEERRAVLVLGDGVKRQLFGDAPAVGEQIILRGIPFQVIGVLASKLQDSSYSGLDKDRVCLPATTHAQVFNAAYVNNFVFRAREPSVQSRVTDEVYRVLGRSCGFAPHDRDALQLWDITEEQRMRSYIFVGFDLMLGASAALTLLVGGVGVGNLMFIRVRRRSREIGILMAMGARPGEMLTQVLLETALLVLVGGTLGFLLAGILIAGVGWSPLTEFIGVPRVSVFIGLVAVVLLGGIGLLAGYFPARRAAHLDPVLALNE